MSFGKSIAHSGKKVNRKFNPNVIGKRVWSESLNDWVRFKMTTAALRAIDHYGGIDNYLLCLDKKSVADSKKISKTREAIASKLFHEGKLSEKFILKMGYHKKPPVIASEVAAAPTAQKV